MSQLGTAVNEGVVPGSTYERAEMPVTAFVRSGGGVDYGDSGGKVVFSSVVLIVQPTRKPEGLMTRWLRATSSYWSAYIGKKTAQPSEDFLRQFRGSPESFRRTLCLYMPPQCSGIF